MDWDSPVVLMITQVFFWVAVVGTVLYFGITFWRERQESIRKAEEEAAAADADSEADDDAPKGKKK